MAEFLLLFALMLVCAACEVHHLNQIKTLIQQERKANERGLTEVADVLERLSLILIYHDATVRGQNPETLGSTEELLRTLRGKEPR